MAAYPTWKPGNCWLYSRATAIDQRIQVGPFLSQPNEAGSNPFLFDWIPVINDRLEADHASDWNCEVSDPSRGIIRLFAVGNASWPISSPGRMLAALGFDLEPGEVQAASLEHFSRRPSPLAIPLLSASPQRIERSAERTIEVDRFRRGLGSTFASNADIWEIKVKLDAVALASLDEMPWGKCGEIIVSPYNLQEHIDGDAVPWSDGQTGYLKGAFMGLSPGEWDNPKVRKTYSCSIYLAQAVE